MKMSIASGTTQNIRREIALESDRQMIRYASQKLVRLQLDRVIPHRFQESGSLVSQPVHNDFAISHGDQYVESPHALLWHMKVGRTPFTYRRQESLLFGVFLSESLEDGLVKSVSCHDVINEDTITCLPLPIYTGNRLIVVLQVPGDPEPDHAMT